MEITSGSQNVGFAARRSRERGGEREKTEMSRIAHKGKVELTDMHAAGKFLREKLGSFRLRKAGVDILKIFVVRVRFEYLRTASPDTRSC